MSRQADDRIAVTEPGEESRYCLGIGSLAAEPDGSGTNERGGGVDFLEPARTVGAARGKSHYGRQHDCADPSPHSRDALPWFAGFRLDSRRSARVQSTPSGVAANFRQK